MGLLTKIAAKLRFRLPPCVDVDDLTGAGSIGLAQAAVAFDSGRRVKFATYAGRRVYGAMLDWLREIDWVPRLERRRSKVDGRRLIGTRSLSSSIAGCGDAEAADLLAADGGADGTVAAERRDLVGRLTAGFTRSERMAFELYWFEGQTMREVGRAIGMSESRVSQVMAELLRRVRAAFGESELMEMLGRSAA